MTRAEGIKLIGDAVEGAVGAVGGKRPAPPAVDAGLDRAIRFGPECGALDAWLESRA